MVAVAIQEVVVVAIREAVAVALDGTPEAAGSAALVKTVSVVLVKAALEAASAVGAEAGLGTVSVVAAEVDMVVIANSVDRETAAALSGMEATTVSRARAGGTARVNGTRWQKG